MLIRRLVIASLLASATAAHADNISTQAAPPSGVVSGWTTGNGTDVLSSGVLQGNLNLVAGVAHTAGAGVSLADVLYGKVAGTIGNVDGQTTLFFQRGIEANYLLASGHGILAATAGPGMSVVGSANGAVLSNGVTKAPGLVAGGGSNQVASSGGGSTSGGGSQSTGSSGGGTNSSGTNGGTNGGGAGNGGTNDSASKDTGSTGNGSQAGENGKQPEAIFLPPQANKPNDNGLAIPVLDTPEATVPEPSSIALMLLGMMGAGAVTRRRTR